VAKASNPSKKDGFSHVFPSPKKESPAPSPFSPENLLHVIPVFKKRRVEAVPPLPDAGVRPGMGSFGTVGWLCSDRVKQVPCFSVVPYSVANKDFSFPWSLDQ